MYCTEIVDAKISAFEKENAELKVQIRVFQPKYPWQEVYHGFNERVEFVDFMMVKYCIWYDYATIK